MLRAVEARIATTKITEEGVARMADAVDRLAAGADATEEEVLATAADFDRELASAADNPALRTMIESIGVIGRARRIRGIAAMRRTAKEVGRRQLQAHRDILAAVMDRDPDVVERLIRAQVLGSLDHLHALDR